ncbi:MAG: M56 family metallopeptidase [Prevotella sp.]|nr:M56 family metallopeptidase [Prevotella sp.]
MMVIYQIKVGLCLVVFYLLFKLLLSRDTLHRFNRALLLVLSASAFVLPWLHMPSLPAGTAAQQIIIGPLTAVESVALPTQPTEDAAPLPLHLIYHVGLAAVLAWQLWSAWQLRRLLATATESISEPDGVRIHLLPADTAPFSFFRYVAISRDDYRDNAREILTHERAHIRLGHSADMLLMNLLVTIQWWNPAAWLLRRELQQIHEYEADEAVLKEGVDARQYQLLLIRKSVGNQLFSMANNLNHNSLKQRIRMMKRTRTPRWQLLKALAVVPVAALLAVACGQKSEKPDGAGEEPLTVGVEVPADAPEVAVTGYDGGAETPKVFDVVEQMPEFPGGMEALMQFLSKNMKYPDEATKAGQEGRVIVSFVVEADGRVTNAKVVKSVAPLLDAEALRVIGLMPRWEPGRQNGEAVRVKYTIPVAFRLQ